MIVTSVQIKTAKTQKHLYCPVFTVGSADIQAPCLLCGAFLFVARDAVRLFRRLYKKTAILVRELSFLLFFSLFFLRFSLFSQIAVPREE